MADKFVVFEPKSDFGEAILDVHSTEESARAAYDESIEQGLASLKCGLYLGKVSNVSVELLTRLYDDANEVIESDFEGFEYEEIDSFASKAEHWDQDALDMHDEEFDNSDETYAITN